ncbi:MAG: hypothetical protein M1819_002749 [Sarea resinae]|nr:MAG: hypothetical protein M1819_002749 [Sarea resinae]
MGSNLKVIALISGGKDSLYSILHCLANGHDVVALGNLYPAQLPVSAAVTDPHQLSDARKDDIDSFMYQTVGHTVIPLYADALGIPLYRQEITGSAANTDRDYSPEFDGSLPGHVDETEALVPLLKRILAIHESANAVSTGAILSDYQRTRVESVAVRLGLVPLSYLWQYPYLPPGLQSSLLDDMAAVGQVAKIIKVASGGLDESFLWENVADQRTKRRLALAVQRFGGSEGGAVLGEGGEFETLAIDGPKPLWKKKIIVDEHDRQIMESGGGTSLVRITKARLEEKTEDHQDDVLIKQLRLPELLDDRFTKIVEPITLTAINRGKGNIRVSPRVSVVDLPIKSWSSTWTKRSWHISNMIAIRKANTAEEQMSAISSRLREVLRQQGSSTDDIVFTTILLRSMSDFAAVNRVYANLFRKPNPPARVTVACGDCMPQDVHIMLSMTVDLGIRVARRGLHVQSRSYWAPANIGPYSQAISVSCDDDSNRDDDSQSASLIYIAGQIPLVPSSMAVIESPEGSDRTRNFCAQTVLSLQHLWRIARVMEVTWWTAGLVFITGEHEIQSKAIVAWEAWKQIHEAETVEAEGEEAEEVDIWDRRLGNLRQLSLHEEPSHHRLPDPEMVSYSEDVAAKRPPFLAIEVDELPRACEIEWTSLGIAHGHVHLSTSSDRLATAEHSVVAGGQLSMVCTSISDASTDAEMVSEIIKAIGPDQAGHDEYASRGPGQHVMVYTTRSLEGIRDLKLQVVPCRSLWGPEGKRLGAGVIVQRGG